MQQFLNLPDKPHPRETLNVSMRDPVSMKTRELGLQRTKMNSDAALSQGGIVQLVCGWAG